MTHKGPSDRRDNMGDEKSTFPEILKIYVDLALVRWVLLAEPASLSPQ